MSGSTLSPKFPTVALQRSKSSASVHSGGGALRHLELAPSIYSLSPYIWINILFVLLTYESTSCSLSLHMNQHLVRSPYIWINILFALRAPYIWINILFTLLTYESTSCSLSLSLHTNQHIVCSPYIWINILLALLTYESTYCSLSLCVNRSPLLGHIGWRDFFRTIQFI